MLKLSSKVRTIAEESGELGSMIRAVRRNKDSEGVYCVMHSDATEGLMEIAPLAYARLEARDRDITVFGLAKGKTNALELVRQIVDSMAKQGRFDVSDYL